MNAGKNEPNAAAPSQPVAERSVNPGELRWRVERLGESAVRVAMYSAPVFFLLITVLLLIVNRGPDVGLFSHITNSLVSGAFAAVACAGVAWFGLFQLVGVQRKNMEILARDGRLVEGRRCGRPTIYGGQLMTYTIGGAWKVLARVDNLADKKYETMLGFPGPGRTFLLGVRRTL